jgi:Mn2+/Fe2+ NRAMP family transporter
MFRSDADFSSDGRLQPNGSSRFDLREVDSVNRLLKPVVYVLAGIYFIVDAVFAAIAAPLADWLAEQRIFDGLRRWILSLDRYPTLALFAVPIIVLEPVKPVAAYLAATGHVVAGLGVLLLGEILKLVLIERLFALCQEKLMSIAAFAWAYRQYRVVREWIEATAAWQAVRRLSKVTRYTIRIYLLELRQRPVRLSYQDR